MSRLVEIVLSIIRNILKFIDLKIKNIWTLVIWVATVVPGDVENEKSMLNELFKNYKMILKMFFIFYLIIPSENPEDYKFKIFNIITFYLFFYYSIFNIISKLNTFNFDFSNLQLSKIVVWLHGLFKTYPLIALSIFWDASTIFLMCPTPGWCTRNLIIDTLEKLDYLNLVTVWKLITNFFMILYFWLGIQIFFLSMLAYPFQFQYPASDCIYKLWYSPDRWCTKIKKVYFLIFIQAILYRNVKECFVWIDWALSYVL